MVKLFRPAHAAAAALVVGNLFLHKPISDVCDALFARLGRGPYEWTALLAIGALSLGAAGLLLRDGAPGLRSRRVLAALAGLAVLTLAAQRLLLVSNIELIHLPQFGLLAVLLLAVGLPAQLAWLVATLAGALDETYQWLVIYDWVPNVSFDWNDVVLNALGAAWAVILARGGRGDGASPGERRWQRALFGALLAAAVAALWVTPPRLTAVDHFPWRTPTLGRAMTGRSYHVMPASEGLATTALIWALVALACAPAAPPTRRRAVAVAAVLVVLLPGCVPRRPPAPPLAPLPAAPARPFFITFWCGPPLAEFTDARAAEIAAAGFDVVGPPCEGVMTPALTARALDVAARHGLRMWIKDPRIDQLHGLAPDYQAQTAAVVEEFGGHPALDGYFLIDEPHREQFEDLGLVVTALRQRDPARVPYVNLLPDYIGADALGTDTYAEHVDDFIAVVRPTLLSVDYYPFQHHVDRDSFFANLALIRDRAQRAGIPWLLIIQALPHGPYRDPTPAELSWQVFNGLAFGARAISYFTYWTPVHVRYAERWNFRRGLIEGGVATDKLAVARDLNAAARAIAGQLDGYASTAVVDADGAFGAPLPRSPVAAIAGGGATLGLFAAADGRRAGLLVNRDYRAARTLRIVPTADAPPAEAFDPASGEWHPAADQTFDLPAGGAQLIRWWAAKDAKTP